MRPTGKSFRLIPFRSCVREARGLIAEWNLNRKVGTDFSLFLFAFLSFPFSLVCQRWFPPFPFVHRSEIEVEPT